MSIKARLIAIILILSAASLAASAGITWIGWTAAEDTRSLMTRLLKTEDGTGKTKAHMEAAHEIVESQLTMTQLSLPDSYMPDYDQHIAAAKAELQTLAGLASTGELSRQLQEFSTLFNQWSQNTRQAISGEPVTQLPMLDVMTAQHDELTARMETLLKTVKDVAQADAAAVTSRTETQFTFAIAIVLLALAGTSLLGFLIANGLSRSLARIISAMDRLAAGHLDITLSEDGRKDEIGTMAQALKTFLQNAEDRQTLENENKNVTEARLAREERVQTMIASFENDIERVIGTLDHATSNMTNTAASLSAVSESAKQTAHQTVSQSGEISTDMQTVGQSAETLSDAIARIDQELIRTQETVTNASDQANRTNAEVAELHDAAQRIGEVVVLIRAIAEQTNLLALNATIEAARAGEAGRGFAIVASEVKGLASQTAKATEDISTSIEQVQASTANALSSISGIADTMAAVNEATSATSDAIRQQSESTARISSSIRQATDQTMAMSRSTDDISRSVTEARQSAGSAEEAAHNINTQTRELKQRISSFLSDVAAA
ncbi:methyl-accepting chemotaxis protein [Coralliovum pocilloporae]|uniref:methyl-accepting chemotaxis protein n=1 Tax=Coralliovum pocilloporae TaxID=3066369 RepID=UPI003306D3B9